MGRDIIPDLFYLIKHNNLEEIWYVIKMHNKEFCMENEVKDKIKTSDMVLIGIGEEFEHDCNDAEKIIKIKESYEVLASLLEKKNYFIMTSCTDSLIYEAGLDINRIVAPRNDNSEYQSEEDYMSRWNNYTKWLGGTLNHSICILELGVLFNYPNIIRWPFEKIAFFNQKSSFIRVNNKLPQLSEDIADKGLSIQENAIEFLLS